MRCQDLFQQRRAGARESDDEYRIASGPSEAGASPEEPPAADAELALRFGLDATRVVIRFRMLQTVAASIVLERCGVLLAILQCLAQCEAEMKAIDERCAGVRFAGLHPLDLGVVELVGLEIAETPVCVAEVGFQTRRPAIRSDCLRLPADGLERVPPMQEIERIGMLPGELLVRCKRNLRFPDRKTDAGVHGAVEFVVRIRFEQHPDLLHGQLELLALAQDIDVVEPRGPEIRPEDQCAFQQELRVVENVEFSADIRQQAHSLGVSGEPLEEVPAKGLRLVQFFPMQQARHGTQVLRHPAQEPCARPRLCRLPCVSARLPQFGERLPALKQRRVQPGGLLVGADSLDGRIQRSMRAPQFLEDKRIVRGKPLKFQQHVQSRRGPIVLQVAASEPHQVVRAELAPVARGGQFGIDLCQAISAIRCREANP